MIILPDGLKKEDLPEDYRRKLDVAEGLIMLYKSYPDLPGHTTVMVPVPEHTISPDRRGRMTEVFLHLDLGFDKGACFFTHDRQSRSSIKMGCDLHAHYYLEDLVVKVRFIGSTLPLDGVPRNPEGYPNSTQDVEVQIAEGQSLKETLYELSNTDERHPLYRRVFGEREPWIVNFLGTRAYNPRFIDLADEVRAQFVHRSRGMDSSQALEAAVGRWFEIALTR